MNYSKRGPDEARFCGVWLCMTKASAGDFRSTAVSSSIIKVTAFVSIFAPPPTAESSDWRRYTVSVLAEF